jgi:ABC-type lipoprotein export system ATPase subunit
MIQLRNVSRVYPASGAALDRVSLEVAAGEFVAITGPSGCGKSTLLHLVAGLDLPSEGEVFVDGLALHAASDAELTHYRRRKIGVVFQFFHLLPTMSVLENVCVPLLLQGVPLKQARARAQELVALVGLEGRASHWMHQLSGGQMQRTAIARALVHGPSLLLADEPTGNLDSVNAGQVMELLQTISSKYKTTLLVVTHSPEVAKSAPRLVEMRDGKVLPDSSR